MKTWYILILLSVIAIIMTHKKIIKIWDDKWTIIRIATLHPSIREKVTAFIQDAANNNVLLRVSSATRTFAQQTALYEQGRTTPGKIVTDAKAGQSYHNFGLGFDVVPMMNGTAPVWDDAMLWRKIGILGKKHGFEWGGDWRKPDEPHFQVSFGLSTSQLLSSYNNGNITNGYVNIT